MNNLFNISSSGKIELNVEALVIPPFDKIWERDETVTKDKATMEIKYIVYLCDYNSPYNAYGSKDKERMIRTDFIRDPSWSPDDTIKEGIKKYEELQDTLSTRILKSAKIGAEKLAAYFEDVDFTQLDDNGKPLYTARDLASNLKSVGDIVKSLVNLDKQVKSEQIESSSVRGKSEIGDYELAD